MKERLQKIIARAGVVSRRKAEDLMAEGRVRVNGRKVTQPGSKADPKKDAIRVDGKRIVAEEMEYFLVHKPPGVLSSVSDPRKRPVVTDLVRSSRRLFPAGRLDFNSEGLILLTNDGEITRSLTRAGKVEKIYRVKVRGEPSEDQLEQLRNGFSLDGESLAPCRIAFLKKARNCWLEVVLVQGKNRQIRRMFDSIGHPVMRLRRTAIGPLQLSGIAPGKSRKLSPQEVRTLKRWCRRS